MRVTSFMRWQPWLRLITVTSKEDNMKPNADMIAGAMEAEAALAKESADELEETIDSLPENHPIRVAAAHERQMMGDLAGLPPGHPLLVAMNDARLRYEAEEFPDEDEEDKDQEQIKIRKAKKLDAKKAAVTQRRKEDERADRLRTATKSINTSMRETMDSIKRLNDNIIASQEDFAGDRYALMKLERLSRVLVATMRGISASKLSAGRAVANG